MWITPIVAGGFAISSIYLYAANSVHHSRNTPMRLTMIVPYCGKMQAVARLQLIKGHVAPGGDRVITREELAKHNSAKSMWIAVDGVVYDMTPFLPEHPGGKRLPLKYAGQDATEVWHSMHRKEVMDEFSKDLRIGVLAASQSAATLGASASTGASSAPRPASGRSVIVYTDSLRNVRDELREFIDEENCHPILIRLAWHDSGTYDKNLDDRWPECGGANGSIRFDEELSHGANAGLRKAVLYLQPFKHKYPIVSWADLIQLAGATALELAGGPKSPLRYGRVDVEVEAQCPPDGRLPVPEPPFPGGADAATHLRQVFGRMGFSDAEIVALSGAHTLGRAFKERSGVVPEGYGKESSTRHTHPDTGIARVDGERGLGMAGGRSWTRQWLAFDNSYYTGGYRNGAPDGAGNDSQLLWMSTDAAIASDPIFRKSFLRYAHDEHAFMVDFASAHAKLAELGSIFDPPEGIRLDN